MPSKKSKPRACTVDNCKKAYRRFVKEIMDNDLLEIAGNEYCFFYDLCGFRNQYRIGYKKNGSKYFRVKTHRMWFYSSAELIAMAEDHKNYTVSHLCHGSGCINPNHLVLESLAVNKSRNVCPAGSKCWHEPKCIREGHQLSNQKIAYWDGCKMSKQSK